MKRIRVYIRIRDSFAFDDTSCREVFDRRVKDGEIAEGTVCNEWLHNELFVTGDIRELAGDALETGEMDVGDDIDIEDITDEEED